jgi:hypothetical protein
MADFGGTGQFREPTAKVLIARGLAKYDRVDWSPLAVLVVTEDGKAALAEHSAKDNAYWARFWLASVEEACLAGAWKRAIAHMVIVRKYANKLPKSVLEGSDIQQRYNAILDAYEGNMRDALPQ